MKKPGKPDLVAKKRTHHRTRASDAGFQGFKVSRHRRTCYFDGAVLVPLCAYVWLWVVELDFSSGLS